MRYFTTYEMSASLHHLQTILQLVWLECLHGLLGDGNWFESDNPTQQAAKHERYVDM